jgi:hypothetical protein
LAGNSLIQIDEDELLEELEALKQPTVTVIEDGVIQVEGERIKLPAVPEGIKSAQVEVEEEEEEIESRETQKTLIAE